MIKHYSILLSITGIILLYFIATLTEPVYIELQKIQEYEGKIVTTTGYVKNYYSTNFNNQIIEIENKNQSIKIFTEKPAEIEYGDLLQITGTVKKYKEEWEILVENKKDIKIIQKWKNFSHPLWEIAQNPDTYLNQNINTTGYIDIIYDEYFYLKDINQGYSLLVFYNNSLSLRTGCKAYVLGRFLFDEKNLRYKLEISSKNHGVFVYYPR